MCFFDVERTILGLYPGCFHRTCYFVWQVRQAYSKALFDSVATQYNVLKTAIYDRRGLGASTADVSLSQPWI